jgi:hypothetical protein
MTNTQYPIDNKILDALTIRAESNSSSGEESDSVDNVKSPILLIQKYSFLSIEFSGGNIKHFLLFFYYFIFLFNEIFENNLKFQKSFYRAHRLRNLYPSTNEEQIKSINSYKHS